MSEVVNDASVARVVDSASSAYSRLVAWEVWNFMSLTHAKAEFDEKNIVNFKGYNNSGKSAMLRALDVLLFNIKPSAQVNFIQDEKDYFRVVGYFDDGVTILRDKYSNGQSLYEMYKDDTLIFTTKQNNHLTKVSEVPMPIADYLGVVSYEGLNLNTRSCFEKQLLVQTTGSENYKFLNSVLKSEEISVASATLNVDKNNLVSDINTLDTQLQVARGSFKGYEQVTAEIVDELHRLDRKIDVDNERLSSLGSIKETVQNLSGIPEIPHLDGVDRVKVDLLQSLSSICTEIETIPELPEVSGVDYSRLELITSISNVRKELDSIVVAPEVNISSVDTNRLLDTERLACLGRIIDIYSSLLEVTEEIASEDAQLSSLITESKELTKSVEEFGVRYVSCPNCGALVENSASCSH